MTQPGPQSPCLPLGYALPFKTFSKTGRVVDCPGNLYSLGVVKGLGQQELKLKEEVLEAVRPSRSLCVVAHAARRVVQACLLTDPPGRPKDLTQGQGPSVVLGLSHIAAVELNW